VIEQNKITEFKLDFGIELSLEALKSRMTNNNVTTRGLNEFIVNVKQFSSSATIDTLYGSLWHKLSHFPER